MCPPPCRRTQGVDLEVEQCLVGVRLRVGEGHRLRLHLPPARRDDEGRREGAAHALVALVVAGR